MLPTQGARAERERALSPPPCASPHRPQDAHPRELHRPRPSLPVADLLGTRQGALLDSFALPKDWRAITQASLRLIEHLDCEMSASEIGEIERFASPGKLTGYTGLCPNIYQPGATDPPWAARQ